MSTVKIGTGAGGGLFPLPNPIAAILQQAEQLLSNTNPDAVPPSKMVIRVSGTQRRVVVPFAPQAVVYDGIAINWQTVARDGARTPLLINGGYNLETISMTLTFVSPGNEATASYEISVAQRLEALKTVVQSSEPIGIQWSKFEYGNYRVTAMTITSVSRKPDTNEISRATVDITFTQSSDAVVNKGPASGGVKNKGKKGKKPVLHAQPLKGGNNNGTPHAQPAFHPHKYTIKKGDTLQSIGMKFYNDHRAWRQIAKANKIKKPHKDAKLHPGKQLILP